MNSFTVGFPNITFLEKGSVLIQNCSNIIKNPNQATFMNRKTGQTQRKLRFPKLLRRKAAKEEPAKVVDETEYPSCQAQGCGCGK